MVAVRTFLQPQPGVSFSDLWYRVAPLRPALSPHCQVVRQRFGPRVSYILEDPAGGQYHRINEAGYFFIALLDGSRSVNEAWEASTAQMGDAALTQRECLDILSRLQLGGLLIGEQPLAPDMISLRRRQALTRTIRSRTGLGFSFTIPLVNPEPFLDATEYLWRAIFSRAGLVVWILAVAAGLYSILTNLSGARGIFGAFNQLLTAQNIAVIGVVFLLLRGLHELGHAAACKAMGARCTEMGLMVLLLVLPFPYCDATSAWRLPTIRQRVVVSLGGILFETFIASLAAIVWARVEPGSIRTVCYSIMLLSGVTTLLFNLNPLMRYDGYYVLSDLTGTANLWQRSRDAWRFLLERVAFGVKAAAPPSVRGEGEFYGLLTYGLLSVPYRLMVSFTIVLIVWSSPQYMTLGAVLAVFAALLFVVWPALKGLGYLLGSPRLFGRRARAVGVSALAAVLLAVVLGVLPWPASATAPGVVRPMTEEPVRPAESGFVVRVDAPPGTPVHAGDALLTLDNPELTAALAAARARVERAQAELDATATMQPAAREYALKGLEQARGELERADARVEALVVRAPVAGTVFPASGTGAEYEALVGRLAQRGALLAFVASADRMLVRASVSDKDQAYVFPDGARTNPADAKVRPSLRVRGRAGEETRATILRFPPVGSRELSAPSLSAPAGGEILLDPTDQRQRTTLVPHFIVDLEPERGAGLQPGQRAQVRFALPARPLAVQWWRRLVQSFSERSPL